MSVGFVAGHYSSLVGSLFLQRSTKFRCISLGVRPVRLSSLLGCSNAKGVERFRRNNSLNSNFMVERSILREIFDFWLEKLSFGVLNCQPILDRKSIELRI